MEERNVIHSTFVIERSYPATPENVFSALSPTRPRNAAGLWKGRAMKWSTMRWIFEWAARKRAISFQGGTPVKGMVCTNDTIYLDIVPNRRDGAGLDHDHRGRCISASLVTVEFWRPEAGTDLIFTHQGAFFEGADGPEMREEGWRKLLDRLTGELRSCISGQEETRYRPYLPRPRRPHAPGDRGEAQPGTDIGLAAGGAARYHPGRGSSAPAGAGGERAGARPKRSGRVRTCRIEPAGLSAAEQWIGDRRSMWERGWTGWAICWPSRRTEKREVSICGAGRH